MTLNKVLLKINRVLAICLALAVGGLMMAVFVDVIYWMVAIKAILIIFGIYGVFHFSFNPIMHFMVLKEKLLSIRNLILDLSFAGVFLVIAIVGSVI